MIDRIIDFSVRNKVMVIAAVAAACIAGAVQIHGADLSTTDR